MKNKLTILLAGTHDYAFALGNVLIGLNKMSPGLADRVVIFHDGISEHDRECLNKICPCIFREYAPAAFAGLSLGTSQQRFSMLTFARYEMFDMLAESEYVLYLDSDIVIHRDISGLLEYRPIGMKKGGHPLNTSLGPNPYGFDDSIKGPNAGIILVHESLPWQGLTRQCYELTVKHWDTLKFPDQGIINLVLRLNGIEVNLFPRSFNSLDNDFSPHREIQHNCIKDKFWSNGIMNLMSPEWESYNREWIELGGTPWQGIKAQWEFNAMHYSRCDHMYLMANVYSHVVDGFVNDMLKMMHAGGIERAFRQDFMIWIPHPEEKHFYFGLKTFGSKGYACLLAKEPRMIEQIVEPCLAELDRMPERDRYKISSKPERLHIKKEFPIRANFFTEKKGYGIALKALREMVNMTLKAMPQWQKALAPVLAFPPRIRYTKGT